MLGRAARISRIWTCPEKDDKIVVYSHILQKAKRKTGRWTFLEQLEKRFEAAQFHFEYIAEKLRAGGFLGREDFSKTLEILDACKEVPVAVQLPRLIHCPELLVVQAV